MSSSLNVYLFNSIKEILIGISAKIDQTCQFAFQDLRNNKTRFLLIWIVHLSSTLTFGYMHLGIGKPKDDSLFNPNMNGNGNGNQEFLSFKSLLVIENLSYEDDLKICGEVISKIMIISQNQQFLQFIFEEPLQSQMLYNAILRFYEKFVKVNK